MKQKRPLFYLLLTTLFISAVIPYFLHYILKFSDDSDTVSKNQIQVLHNFSSATEIGLQSILESYHDSLNAIAEKIPNNSSTPDDTSALLEKEQALDSNIIALAVYSNGKITSLASHADFDLSSINITRNLSTYQNNFFAISNDTKNIFPVAVTIDDNSYLVAILNAEILSNFFDNIILHQDISINIITNSGLIIQSSIPNEKNTTIQTPEIIDYTYSRSEGFFKYHDKKSSTDTSVYSIPLATAHRPTNLTILSFDKLAQPDYLSYFLMTENIIPVILLFIISIIVASILYRYLIDPVNQLLTVITYIQSGIFNYELKLNRHGEFGQLLKAFNDMIKNLEKRFQYQKRMRQEILLRNRYEEKLKSSRAEAVSLSKAKDEFLANISHEIRTPLNAIIGYSEKILLEHPEETFSKNVKTILSESDHLLLLLNDLLDNAKIEADKLDLEYIPFDLHKCIIDTTESYKEAALKKNLAFSLEISEDTPRHVVFDPLRFKQVLVNLLSNAIKFTEKGSITVKTAVTNVTEDHADVYFSVIDTGIGIPEEKQQSIFDEFSQADGSTTRKYGGTGLGTTISKKLVTLMGGEMCLKSELGKGSTFWFTLSLSTNISESDMIKINRENNSTPGDNANKFSGTILVAEDYEVNQELIRSQLEYLGLNVLIANNGRIAVEDCKRVFFDLIFMDLQMPEMGGIEAARRIRIDYPHYEKVPIIALTANADKDIRNVCNAVGMNGILNKPTHIDELAASLLKWLPKSCQLSPVSIPKQIQEKSAGSNFAEDDTTPVLTESAKEQSPETEDIEPPVDFEQAYTLFGNNKTIFDMALKNFMTSVEGSLIQILEESNNTDAEELRRTAHKLKGGAASITARRLSRIAGRLEKEADKSSFEQTDKLISEIKAEFKTIKDYINSQKKK